MSPDIPCDHGQVLTVPRESDPRALERGQRQRRLADRQHRQIGRCDTAQVARALLQVEGVGQLAHLGRKKMNTDATANQSDEGSSI